MPKFRFFTISILFSTFFAVSCTKPAEKSFTISGSIINFENGRIVFSVEEDINRKQSRIVSEIQADNNGNFDIGFDLEPHIYTLEFNGKKKLMLAIDKGQKISVKGDANDWSTLTVSGSPDTAKLEEYERFRKQSLAELVTKVRDDIKKLQDANDPANDTEIKRLSDLEIENFKKHKDVLIDFIGKNMETSIALYPTSLRWDGDHNVAFLESLVKNFELAHPNLVVTSKIKEKVGILKNTSIGGTAPDIKMRDKDGIEKSLSSIKAKYILIDFWGSWCGPCRREASELSEYYKRFNPQGFEIYGVGLESEKEEWLEAMKKDERIWVNVSALQEFETPVTFEFGVTSLPANFLVDSERKIVGKNLHGKRLSETLEKLLAK